MSENCTVEKLGEIFDANDSFLIISHVTPDGDAIGSTLALGSVLEKRGKKVYYRNEDGVPNSLTFLPSSESVEQPSEAAIDFDVVVALDCATKPRLGKAVLALAEGAKFMVNIDHHKTNTRYGDFNYIDSNSPATGQILYNIFKQLDYSITDVARDNIYVAVSTDTGSFRYRGTTEATYKMAADLVSKGLDVSYLNEQTYEKSPLRKVKLLGELLSTLELRKEGKVAFWCLTQQVKDELELLADDSEDMINHIRSIEGVLVACSFEDVPGGFVRVSLRSKSDDLDVSDIALKFGGGGHARAAGIRFEGSIAEASAEIIAEVEKAL